MQYAFMSDQPPKPYDQFILKALSDLADMTEGEIQGIAVVAISPTATYSTYWNMSYSDKCKAESTIRSDVFDMQIQANKERYFNEGYDNDDDEL